MLRRDELNSADDFDHETSSIQGSTTGSADGRKHQSERQEPLTPTASTLVIVPFSSPIPPRFAKHTLRGAKRSLTMDDYESERKRQRKETFTGVSAGQILTTDQWIYRQIKGVISPRFIALSRQKFDCCLKKKIPDTYRTLEDGVTRNSIANNVEIIGSHYYKFYRHMINKTRSACYQALSECEPCFERERKPRGNGVRGRDLKRWFDLTETMASELEQIVQGNSSVLGFRARLLKSYNELLSSNGMNENRISRQAYINLVKSEPFFVIIAVACNRHTSLYDTLMNQLEDFDMNFRPSLEALIIHAWYCYLWVIDMKDETQWTEDTISNIVQFVLRDRRTCSLSWDRSREAQSRPTRQGKPQEAKRNDDETVDEENIKLNGKLLRKIISKTKAFCDFLPMTYRPGTGNFDHLDGEDHNDDEDTNHRNDEDNDCIPPSMPYNPDEDVSTWY